VFIERGRIMPTGMCVEWEYEVSRTERWELHADEESSTAEDLELQAEIKRAETILDLEVDWDGESSVAYTQETFDRAVNFLTAHSAKLHEMCKLHLPVPNIGPGPNGSIDLHWKNEDWELLVNIPGDVSRPASFYGDDYGVQKIKGSLDPKTINLGIVAWLMRH
jgi:hypothetical protein